MAAKFPTAPFSITHPKAFSHGLLLMRLSALPRQVVPDGTGTLADTGQAGKKIQGGREEINHPFPRDSGS